MRDIKITKNNTSKQKTFSEKRVVISSDFSKSTKDFSYSKNISNYLKSNYRDISKKISQVSFFFAGIAIVSYISSITAITVFALQDRSVSLKNSKLSLQTEIVVQDLASNESEAAVKGYESFLTDKTKVTHLNFYDSASTESALTVR